MPIIGGPGAYQPLGVDTSVAVAGPAYTNPRPAYDLLMWNGGANTIPAYDTGGSDSSTDWQTAINAAFTNFNAGIPHQRLRMNSRAKYTIGGAVQTGAHGELTQIVIPMPTNPSQACTLEIIGGDYGGIAAPGILGYGQTARTIIETTIGSAPTFAPTTGIASTLGGPASYSTNNTSVQNPVRLGLKGLAFRSAAPKVCGVDAGHMTGLFFDDLVFDTDAVAGMSPTSSLLVSYYAMLASGTYVVTSAPQAIPLIMPLINTVFGTNGGRLSVSNWLCGPVIGEYGDVDHIEVFGVGNAALNLDCANQPFRIGTLVDLDNAWGIGGVYPTAGNTIFSPSNPGGASNVTATTGEGGKVDIGTWMVQPAEPSPTAPAALARQADGLDSANICEVMAVASKTVGGSGVISNAWNFYGSGASLTGALSRWRVIDRAQGHGPRNLSGITSGVPFRNPFNRDGILLSTAPSAAVVDGVTLPFNTVIPMGAQSVVTLTYSGTPTLTVMCF